MAAGIKKTKKQRKIRFNVLVVDRQVIEGVSVVRAAARFDIVVKHLLHKNLLLAGGKSKTDSRKKLRQLGYFGFPRPL